MKALLPSGAFCSMLILTACSAPEFDILYNSEGLAAHTYIRLPRGESPRIQRTFDIKGTLSNYLTQGYVVIGTMKHSGERIPYKDILDYASDKGASLVLLHTRRTGSTQHTYHLPSEKTYNVSTRGSLYSQATMNSYHYSGQSTISTTEWKEYGYEIGLHNSYYLFLARSVS